MGQFYSNFNIDDKKDDHAMNDYKKFFEEYEHNPPSLQESLNQMFKSANIEDKKIKLFTDEVMDKCKRFIDKNFIEIKTKFNKISKDDAYIICSYTVDIKELNYCPYRIVNGFLSSKNGSEIEKIAKYLYLFLKSLRKLPRYYPPNKYLYRAVTYKVFITADSYNKEIVPYIIGQKKTFYAFTSTSVEPKNVYCFLSGNNGQKSGTIFSLCGDVWGYDIQLFNYFNEEEILLEPGVNFIVENVLPPINDIINITCKVINNDEKNINKDNPLMQNKEKQILEEEIKKLKESLDNNNQIHLNEMSKLKIENENLKEEVLKAKKIIKALEKDQIDNNELKNLKAENENLKNQLTNKNNEIKDLKSKIIERPKYDINDIMVVNFVSLDLSVHHGIKCLPTDVFAEVEEKLYKIYDNLRNTNNMFTVNANPILRFKTLSENNIKDGNVIQLIKIE